MNYEEMNNNKLHLQGVVTQELVFSHEVCGEGFYETFLKIGRLSGQVDIIPITISERLIEKHNIKVGDEIAVVGQFRSYNKILGEKSKLVLTAFVREVVELSRENPNEIQLTGYICKQPIYRVTPFKREICDTLVAVNRAYGKSDYIPCILWGRNARYTNDLAIGKKLTLWGRVQSRKYMKIMADGREEERVAYEVSVSKIEVYRNERMTEENNTDMLSVFQKSS